MNNYDFETNKDKVIKHLSSAKYKKYYATMKKEYLKQYPEVKQYCKGRSPGSWGRGDSYSCKYSNFVCDKKYELKNDFPKTKEGRKELNKKIQDLVKHELWYWVPMGLCHWFNTYVSIHLANEPDIFLPEDNKKRPYVIRSGPRHTTVIHYSLVEEGFLSTCRKTEVNPWVFDPQYYLCHLDKPDKGAIEAFIDSCPNANEITRYRQVEIKEDLDRFEPEEPESDE